MCGVLGVERVAGHHRVEVGLAAVVLGSQQPAQPLSLLLAGAERTRNLDGDRRFRQIDREVRDLADDQLLDLTRPKTVEQFLPLLVLGRPLDNRGVQRLTQFVELVEVRADDQRRCVGVPFQDRLHHRDLGVRGGTQLVPFVGFGDGVGHPFGVRQGHPHLDAVGGRDPPLRLDVLPRRVVPLGSDQREHVALTAILAHQGGGEAEASTGLQVGGHAEHRCGQEVHLVVDHETPVAGIEEFQMLVFALGAPGDHLVRGDRDRADLLALARVLADLLLGERRARDQLALPLRPATVFVTRINVVAFALAIAAAPTIVLPAPQGRTTTPDPPAQNESAAIS